MADDARHTDSGVEMSPLRIETVEGPGEGGLVGEVSDHPEFVRRRHEGDDLVTELLVHHATAPGRE